MVLKAIALLGDLYEEEGLSSVTGVRSCLELIFRLDDYSFIKHDLSEFDRPDRYLYHTEKSGKPGMFLSWSIPRGDIEKFRRIIDARSGSSKDEEWLTSFWKKKFDWFGGLYKRKWLEKSAISSGEDLESIHRLCKAFTGSIDRIHTEVTKELREYVFVEKKGWRENKLLVAIVFQDTSGKRYPREIAGFRNIFVDGVRSGTQDEELTCSICNSGHAGKMQTPYPLRFITQDQSIFAPGWDVRNSGKAMPLCVKCKERLLRGQAFIDKHLTFNIFNSRLQFWLIPVGPRVPSTNEYIRALGGDGSPLYLKDLRSLCEGMELAGEGFYEFEGSSEAEHSVTFTSVFYSKDREQMRIYGIAEGVYPSRLRELVAASRAVQQRYPYLLANSKILFGFPLLQKFFRGEKSSGATPEVMEDLFLRTALRPRWVLERLASKVESAGLHRGGKDNGNTPLRKKMSSLGSMALEALITLEYLEESDIIESRRQSGVLLTEDDKNDQYVNKIQTFIDAHRFVAQNETAKSVFLTGVVVGTLLEVQMKLRGSYPFWDHLNRLELDVRKVMSLFPRARAKLMQYTKGEADAEVKALRPMVAFAGANLNFDETSLDKDSTALIFTIGLSEGYIIYHSIKI